MPSSSMPLSRRQLLKRTATATTALGACTTTSGASDHLPFEFPTAFESHLPQEYEGPFAVTYRVHFPERTNLKYRYEMIYRDEKTPLAACRLFDGQDTSAVMNTNWARRDTYACGSIAGECEGEANVGRPDRDSVIVSSSEATTEPFEAGTVWEWTIVSPTFAPGPIEGPDERWEYPWGLTLQADAPLEVSVEAGQSIVSFDRHTFEDGAAASTDVGSNAPAPILYEQATDGDVRYDQGLVAGFAEPKIRFATKIDSAYFLPGRSVRYGTGYNSVTRLELTHPGGSEQWLHTGRGGDGLYTLVGVAGLYRLTLDVLSVHSKRMYDLGGFLAGVQPVEDVRDVL